MLRVSAVSKPWMSTARYADTGVLIGDQERILGHSFACIQTESIVDCLHAVNMAARVLVEEVCAHSKAPGSHGLPILLGAAGMAIKALVQLPVMQKCRSR